MLFTNAAGIIERREHTIDHLNLGHNVCVPRNEGGQLAHQCLSDSNN